MINYQIFGGIGNRTRTIGVRIYLSNLSSIELQYVWVLTQWYVQHTGINALLFVCFISIVSGYNDKLPNIWRYRESNHYCRSPNPHL